MILQKFIVHDAKAQAYLRPFYIPTIGMAVRTFEETCNETGHEFNKWPQDYSLYHCGEWDDQSGDETPLEAKLHLGTASNFKRENTNGA